MIPERITEYLTRRGVPFELRPHDLAVSAQRLAASLHVSGDRVAKPVLVEADGKKLICVLPATGWLNTRRLAHALGAEQVRLLREDELAGLFPDCELGAEPPFGGLYGLPMIVDETIAADESILLRAGSHEDTIELTYRDFSALESPRIAAIAGREASPLA